MLRSVSAIAVSLLMLTSAEYASAERIYCSITAAKQGVLSGDHGLGGDATLIPILALSEEVISPRDSTTGSVTGQLQHKPIVLLKSLDRASPQLFLAAITSENLSTVSCLFYRDRAGNKSVPHFKMVLRNAGIADLKIVGHGVGNDTDSETAASMGTVGDRASTERESLSLVYQRMEMTDLDSNITVTDDWSADSKF